MATFKEIGNFTIVANEVKIVFLPNQPPNPKELQKIFSKTVAGTPSMKRFNISQMFGELYLYCKDCIKMYSETDKFFFSKNEDICLCHPRTQQVHGADHEGLMEQLKFIINSQVRAKSCIADIVKRFQTGTLENIAEVKLYMIEISKRFRVILTTNHANAVLQKYLMDTDRQPFKSLLLDATGKITAPINCRTNLHHVLLAPVSKSSSAQCFLVSVGEMVTVRFNLESLPPAVLKRLRQIGTDDSGPTSMQS